jgi:hypothetical protein
MADIVIKIPSPTEVRQLMNEAYNVFYKKWINPDTVYDPEAMMCEVRNMDKKYDCQLCRELMIGLAESIDLEIMRRRN